MRREREGPPSANINEGNPARSIERGSLGPLGSSKGFISRPHLLLDVYSFKPLECLFLNIFIAKKGEL